MANIYLIKKSKDMLSRLKGIKEELIKKGFGGKVAVKLHMGEKGNKTHLNPELVKAAVDILKELKCKPFLFDSTSLYKGARHTAEDYLKTARENGFSEETMGCPVIVSDDFVIRKTKHLEVHLCRAIADADALLVISHVKGHECAGFGGAIKNLGMGAVDQKTKKDIHTFSQPELTLEKCTLCGTCERICGNGAVKISEKKGVKKPRFNAGLCIGCNKCVNHCPEKALKPQIESFDLLLAEAASAAIKNKNCYYINELMRITKNCDCYSDAGEIIASDVGIIYGEDIVAIDKASVDLVNKNNPDVFEKSQKVNPYGHVKEAEKLRMGSGKYALKINVL